MIRAYHYTRGPNFTRIVEQGVILRSGDKDESHLPKVARTPPRERSVWLTLGEEWEPTALPALTDGTRRFPCSFEEMCRREGAYRIAVDAGLFPDSFEVWARRTRSKLAPGLLASARERSAPVHLWRVSYEPIPARLWLGADEWLDGAWTPIDLGAWKEGS